jgi:hypothetical protein
MDAMDATVPVKFENPAHAQLMDDQVLDGGRNDGGLRQTRPQEPEGWMQAPKDADGGVVTVNVRVALKKVSRVDTVQGTAYVKLGLVFYWTDGRLAGWPGGEDLPKQLWTPLLLLTSAANAEFYSAPDGLHLIGADTGRLKVTPLADCRASRDCRVCV